MSRPSDFPLRQFLLLYGGGLGLTAAAFTAIAWNGGISSWHGFGMIGAFALLGAVLYLTLNQTVVCPAAATAAYAENILEGRYGAEGGPDSELNRMVAELATRYKERLGFSRSILEGMPMPICIVDTDQRITFLNRECLNMLGSTESPQSYYGRMISQIFYKDDRRSLIADCMDTDTKRSNVEAVFRHADGSDINVLINLFPLRDVEGTVTGGCCVYLDTTELKRHEAKIVSQNERIAKAAGEATAISLELAEASTQLKAVVEQARSGTRIQDQRIEETATAMEEMTATVIEVARNAVDAAEGADEARSKAGEGAAVVTEAVGTIHEVATHANGLRTSMEELERRAEDIGKVLSVIEDIADQTNLLALNAAIEAARAGEAGRGFAVVADEVRKLAEKTMAATSEVHNAIVGIQEGARKNVRATEAAVDSVNLSTEMASRSGEALNSIVTMAESTSDMVRTIATAAEQQSAASEEINQATTEVSRVCGDTDALMADASESVARLAQLADSLSAVIHEMQ
ncbi:MAG: methyl-accepting chemotaxis protein [Desulfovibrionaceae bacterium]|nr:methyl-accepting chemotaxis protein [Desulfovibrionaceae bacterium]